MKNKHDTMWRCVLCNKPTTTLHEIFPGSARRDICIKYNLQVPLCFDHHHEYHNSTVKGLQEKRQRQFCDYLLIDRDDTLLAINNKSLRAYLVDAADICRQKIEELES